VVEIERAGIPTAQVTTMTPVALMMGSNRIILGNGIVHPLGDVELSPKAEKMLRRAIVENALEALQVELSEQKIFPSPIKG
jgi:betaine reductase